MIKSNVPRFKGALAVVAAVTLSATGLAVSAAPASAVTAPIDLGGASAYVLLASAAITNVGASSINGISGSNSLGVGATYTAALGAVTGGYQLVQGSGTTSAITDASNAHSQGLRLRATNSGTSLTASTPWLTPGVYDAAGALSFAANYTLTLDAQGDSNATFVMRVPAALTFGASDNISLINGAQAGNVFWIVGAATTVGAQTQLVGRVLSAKAITLGAGATVIGQLLAVDGAITLDSNSINNTTPSSGSGAGSGAGSGSGGTPAPAATVFWLRDGVINTSSTVGIPYSAALAVSSSATPTVEVGAAVFSVIGALPAGLTLGSSGALTGTPSATGTSTFVIRADIPGLVPSFKTYTMTTAAGASVAPPVVVWMDPRVATDPTVGKPYSHDLSVAKSTTPTIKDPTAVLSLSSGELPPGLRLVSGEGVLRGTPTTAGTYAFTVKSEIPGATPTYKTFNMKSSLPDRNQALWINGTLATTLVVRTRYKGELAVGTMESGKVIPSSADYEVDYGSLPPGLALRAGVLSGVPTRVGIYSFGIVANVENCAPITADFDMVVSKVRGSGASSIGGNAGSADSDSAGSASASAVTQEDGGKVRVIYRMSKNGNWNVVPRFRRASNNIPKSSLFSVVISPIPNESKNIDEAQTEADRLADDHTGDTTEVLTGTLWRGPARIVVSW